MNKISINQNKFRSILVAAEQHARLNPIATTLFQPVLVFIHVAISKLLHVDDPLSFISVSKPYTGLKEIKPNTHFIITVNLRVTICEINTF